MKPERLYERRQSAGRMEAAMIVLSIVGIVAGLFAFLSYGWSPALTLILLGAIAFALSRVFDLLADLLASVGGLEEAKKQNQSEKADSLAPPPGDPVKGG